MQSTQDAYVETNQLFDENTQYVDPGSSDSPMKDSPQKSPASTKNKSLSIRIDNIQSLQQTADVSNEENYTDESSDAEDDAPERKKEPIVESFPTKQSPLVTNTYPRKSETRTKKRKRRSNGSVSNPKDHAENPGVASEAKKKKLILNGRRRQEERRKSMEKASKEKVAPKPTIRKSRRESAAEGDKKKGVSASKQLREAIERAKKDALSGENRKIHLRSRNVVPLSTLRYEEDFIAQDEEETTTSSDEENDNVSITTEELDNDDTETRDGEADTGDETDASTHYGTSQDSSLEKRTKSHRRFSNPPMGPFPIKTNLFLHFCFIVSVNPQIKDDVVKQILEHSGEIWDLDKFNSNLQGMGKNLIFVQDTLSTTMKSLFGRATGCPIVKPQFITASIRKKRVIVPVPKKFLLNAQNFPDGAHLFMPDAYHHRLLAGKEVMISDTKDSNQDNFKHLISCMGASVQPIPGMTTSNEWTLKIKNRADYILLYDDAPNRAWLLKIATENKVPLVNHKFFVETLKAGKPVLNEVTLVGPYRDAITRDDSDEETEEEIDLEDHGIKRGSDDEQPAESEDLGHKYRDETSTDEDTEDEEEDVEMRSPEPKKRRKIRRISTGHSPCPPARYESLEDALCQHLSESWLSEALKKWKKEFAATGMLSTAVPAMIEAKPTKPEPTPEQDTFSKSLVEFLHEKEPRALETWQKEFALKGQLNSLPDTLLPVHSEKIPERAESPHTDGFTRALLTFLERDCPDLYQTWNKEYKSERPFSRIKIPAPTAQAQSQQQVAVPSELAVKGITEVKSPSDPSRTIEYPKSYTRSDTMYKYHDSIIVDGITYRVNDTVFINLGSQRLDIGVLKSIKEAQFGGDEASMCEYARFVSYRELVENNIVDESMSTQGTYNENELFLTDSVVTVRVNCIAFKGKVLCPRLASSQATNFHFCRRKVAGRSITRLEDSDLWNGFLNNTVILDKEPELLDGREHFTLVALNGTQIQYGMWVYLRAVDPNTKRFVTKYVIVDDIWKSRGFMYVQFRETVAESGVLKGKETSTALFILPAHQILEIQPLTIVNSDDSSIHVPYLTREMCSKHTNPAALYNKMSMKDICDAGCNVLQRRIRVIPFSGRDED